MKQAVRGALSRSRRRARRDWEPLRRRLQGVLTREQLAGALGQAGVVPGATVMTHVSMNEVARCAPGVDALSLIALLKELLTPSGTLLVLTAPFTGLQADYVATNPTFDVRRTPSRMGLMTELFRRMPDTLRSLHPTHSVAGWGAHAAELLATHHEGETFAETSPYWLMRDYGGVVLGIGVGIRDGFTVIHCAEYRQAPEHAFFAEPTVLSMRDGDRTFQYAFRCIKPGLGRRLRAIERALRATGAVRYRRHSGLLISTGVADTFIAGAAALISRGSFYHSTVAPRV